MPVEALIARAFAVGGKGRLEELLKETKQAAAGAGTSRRATFRTSGTRDEIADAVREAVEARHLSLHRLATIVDALEENGGQHIFLYGLTDLGVAALTAEQLARKLPGTPRAPTEAYYSDAPMRRTHFENRSGVLVIKQIGVAEYWERNERESSETNDKKVYVLDKVRRRAVNMVRVRPSSRQVEVRIDRARPQYDAKLALELFDLFEESLENVIDFSAHLRTLPIWRGFHDIIQARDETYMSTDEGYDPSVIQRLSNLRGGRRGTDIRDHENFRPDNTRDHLNVWWKLPIAPGENEDSESRYLHSILSRIERRDEAPERAKVYFGSKAEPAELDHALNRIRSFTR